MGIKEALFENFHGFVEGDKNAEIMVTSCGVFCIDRQLNRIIGLYLIRAENKNPHASLLENTNHSVLN